MNLNGFPVIIHARCPETYARCGFHAVPNRSTPDDYFFELKIDGFRHLRISRTAGAMLRLIAELLDFEQFEKKQRELSQEKKRLEDQIRRLQFSQPPDLSTKTRVPEMLLQALRGLDRLDDAGR